MILAISLLLVWLLLLSLLLLVVVVILAAVVVVVVVVSILMIILFSISIILAGPGRQQREQPGRAGRVAHELLQVSDGSQVVGAPR